MNYTFYDENLLNNGNHSGEDAHPYADDKLLIIADGLGGSGAFQHRKMNDKLFDPEELDSVFDFNGDKEIEAYAKTMFSEFYRPILERDTANRYPFPTFPKMDVAEYKKADPERIEFYKGIKKSGYYASHMVAVLVRQYFSRERIDSCFGAVSDATDEERAALCQTYGNELAKYIAERMHTVAKRADLTLDTPSLSKMLVLPTTLVTALLNEPEEKDYTEAILFWAGDSRAFCFTENKGLQQLTADDESATGVMTNRISYGADFTINCRYVRVPKPCAIFLTSDGFFDYFTSNLDMEYYLLYALSNAESFDDMGKNISSQLFRAGYLDDSCSISLHLSGYDFAEFKQSTVRRCEALCAEYQGEMENIFTEDYSTAYSMVSDSLSNLYKKFNDAERASVQEFAIKKVTAEDNDISAAEIEKMIEEKNQAIAAKEVAMEAERANAEIVFKKYWTFGDAVESLRCKLQGELAELEKKKQEHLGSLREESKATVDAITELYNRFKASAEKLPEMIEEASVGTFSLPKDDGLVLNARITELAEQLETFKKNLKKALLEQKSFMSKGSLLCQDDTAIQEMRDHTIPAKIAEEINKQQKMAERSAEKDPEQFKQKTAVLLATEEGEELLKQIPREQSKDAEALKGYVEKYHTLSDEKKALIANKENVKLEFAERYIQTHRLELIIWYIKENKEFFNAYVEKDAALRSLLNRYPAWLSHDDTKTAYDKVCDIVDGYQLREKLYARYDATYEAYLENEK